MAHNEEMEHLIAQGQIHDLIRFILSSENVPEDVLVAAVSELPPARRSFIEEQCRAWNSKTEITPGEAAAYADIIRTFFAMSFGIDRRGSDILAFAARVRQLRDEGVVGSISDVRFPQYGEIPLSTLEQRASGG